MPSLLHISDLSKSFAATRAVDAVSFSAGRGEVVGFLGPNGAGKTTTMRMIAGFLSPDRGSILVDGVDIEVNPAAAKAKIGYLPEGAPLYGDMSVIGFLRFIAAARRIPATQRQAAIDRVTQRLALEPMLHRRIDTLSKGFKRRVGIAQAIIHNPPVLILDEPTDGLDPNQKHEMRALIGEMAAKKTIVISTHLLEEVDAVCTRAIIIDAGRIRFDGTPDALRKRSAYHNAVVVTLSAEAANRALGPLTLLGSVKTVKSIPLGLGMTELVIRPVQDRPILIDVQAVLGEVGIAPDSIAVERGRLGEVFRSLTVDAREGGIETAEESL